VIVAPTPPPAPAVAHTLTLEFGRALSETEWRDLISRVRQLPYVKRLRVDAVPRIPVK
jgi:hypothetical protein